MNFLTACIVVRNEHPYMREWLAYHRLIGVERFHVYDNGSQPPMRALLADEPDVTVHDWPGAFSCTYQCRAYNVCKRDFGHETRWIVNLDIDEFLFPKHESLHDLLADFDDFAGLAVNWQMFGPNGHVSAPPGGVLESYTTRAAWNHPGNRTGKTIYQPSKVREAKTHIPVAVRGQRVVNTRKQLACEEVHAIAVDRVQVNHYYTKSEQEWRDRKMANDMWDPPRKTIERFRRWRDCTDVHDTAILERVAELGGLPPC